MARDYAKRRSRSYDNDNGRWRWPLAVILLILFAIGIFYLKQQSDKIAAEQGDDDNGGIIQRTLKGKDEQPAKSSSAKKSTKKSAEKDTAPAKAQPESTPQPKFDFYTMLPKNQVSVAPAKIITPPTPSSTTTVAKTNATTAKPIEPKPAVTATEKNTNTKATPDNKATVAVDQEDLIAAEIQKLGENKVTSSTKAASTPATNTKDVKNYIVQLGVFRNPVTADQFKAQLVLQGYEAKIKPLKKSLYCVWLGPYSTLAAAKDQQHALQANRIKSRISKE